MSRLLRRAFYILVCILLLVAIGLWYATEHVLPYSPIRPHRVTREEIAKYHVGNASPSALGMKFDNFHVVAEDTILLKGWFIYARTDTPHGTMILLHGIASCKEAMLLVAEPLTRAGYNCIVYDQRANGESGGANCTFGYYEKYDVVRVIDEATKRFQNTEPIGILGNSYGAAVSLQAMAIDKRIKCGVIENSFASLREIFHDYFARMFFLRLNCVVDKALAHSERIAHFSVDSVKPEVAAKQVSQPVLIVHGVNDKHISVEYGKRIFANVISTKKEWYPIEGGDHYNLSSAGGEAYLRKLLSFLRENLIQ